MSNKNDPVLLVPNQSSAIVQKMNVPLHNSPTNLSNVQDFSNVCRTCATITEFVMPIFSGEGLQNDLADKIKRHLPIQVQENDELPLVVCYQCSSTLLAWHELVKCSIQADAALRAKISSQRKTNPTNITVKSSSSVEEEAQSKSKPEFSRPQPQQYRTCVYCASTHPVASYQKHLVVEHSHRLFHCEECDTFVDRKDFVVHMSFHALHFTAKGITRKKFKKKEDTARQIPSTLPPARAPQCPPKTQSPQCAPKTQSPQCAPKTQSPQCPPKTQSPQSAPKTQSPQSAPKTQSPQSAPKTQSPQSAPKTQSPQSAPKTQSPQCPTKTQSPQCPPKTQSPQCAPKTQIPQCPPKTQSPQCPPKTQSPQCPPKTQSPQCAPETENSQCLPITQSPQCTPKTENSQCLPIAQSPQCAPKTENPQTSPKTQSQHCAPKIENPQASLKTQSPHCAPKIENPQASLKTEGPQYAPKIESKPIIKTEDMKPPVVVKTKTSVQENEFSDHSDLDGFEPLPESVFEAIEDSQDGQHSADNTTDTPESQPHRDKSKVSSQPENYDLSTPAPSLEKKYKFNNCSVVIKPININNCAQMIVAIKNIKVNNNPATPPQTTDACTSGNHPTDEKKRNQKTRKCPFCPKECRAASSYFYHLKYIHKKIKEHECEVCGRKFNTRSCLTQHMAIHAAQYEFECQQCQKQFKTKASLYIHQQTHSDKKSWSCSHCETSFRWKAQLQRHMKRHAAEKGHVCETCGRGFSVRSDLLRHARTHSAGNFTCDICGQKFAQLRYLKVHTTKQHSTTVRKGSK